MNFIELVKKRQSDRHYLDKPVEKEKINRCLEAARLAPSATNSQPWEFIVVSDDSKRRAVANALISPTIQFNKFAASAPVLVVVNSWRPKLSVSIAGILKNKQFNLIDTGIASEHFCLQAAEEGLGTCMLGWFNEKKIKNILSIKAPKRPYLVISLGYPARPARTKKRRPLDKIAKHI